MEMLLVLALLGGGAYWFFKGNIRRGAEIMRAHLYLLALEHHKTKLEANGLAAHDMSGAPPELFQMATSRAIRDYGGVKLAMVSEAYRLGMHPKLPSRDRASAYAAFEEVANRRKSDASPQSAKIAATRAAQPFPGSYSGYYTSYIADLKRLSGLTSEDRHKAELMEEIGEAMGANLTRQNFEQGVDPKEYAAAVHAVLQRNQPASDFEDFDSYFAAYIAELRHLAGTKPGRFHPAELMVKDGVRLAYADRVPPQALAEMIHNDELHRLQS